MEGGREREIGEVGYRWIGIITISLSGAASTESTVQLRR